MNAVANTQPFSFGLEYIRSHFGTNTALAVQQESHNLFRSNPRPLVDHILRSLELTGTERVLDLGCGNGMILRDVVSRLRAGGSAVAVDISSAMLKLAQQNVTVCWVPLDFVEGSAEALPQYPDGDFDRIMANFIFHYIEDPDRVCAEIRRLLAPGGRALVSIEARNSMPEMYHLHFASMEKVGFPEQFIARLPKGRRGKMVLDNSQEILSRHFAQVDERPYVDSLKFESTESFMRFYVDGHRYCGAKAVTDDSVSDILFENLHTEVEDAVTRRIKEFGFFELSKQNSVFVCS